MGGRGRASDSYYQARAASFLNPRLTLDERRQARGYSAVSVGEQTGGASYPFLDSTTRAWRLVSYEVEAQPEPLPEDTLGLGEPTLRWVGDSGVHDLYVDGLSTEEFLAATGLRLDLARKGGFVLSKRLSRLMRPYLLKGFFAPEDVRIGYLQQNPDEAKVWDGAGLVSRQMLQKLVLDDDLDSSKRAELERELAQAGRVEVTLMTPAGQDKGHAVVVEELRDAAGEPVDFLLPQDTKAEVSLHNGTTFVGISTVHGKAQMRLDIQSLIHLREFFGEAPLLERLAEEGELFRQAIESGAAGAAMARIGEEETLAEVQQWHLREYLASGGDPRWFGSPVKTLLGQHLKRLNENTLDKLRLPLPGGRYYVMPAGVGQRGGLKLSVPRGHLHLDPARGTAWVNDADWLALEDSPTGEGLADIWGGADNDDALWLYPFTDEADGARKVLAWRSPNQLGEYVVLKPTAGSPELTWETADGIVSYPAADSRQLPARIDRRDQSYLGLVDPDAAGGVGEGQAYSVAAMAAALERAQANAGALGMYCNALMLHKALFGTLPDQMPAPLEDVIDGTVKTGAGLDAIKAWCYQHTRQILERGVHVPERVRRRLSVDPSQPPWALVPPVLGTDGGHWLDRLDAGVAAHIEGVQQVREQLVSATMPPARLFDAAFEDPASIRLGAQYNQRYAATLKQLQQAKQGPSLSEQVQAATEAFLAPYTADEERAILRKQLFDEAWRELARHRPSGSMTEWDKEAALRHADERLAQLTPGAQAAELRQRIFRQQRYRLERERDDALSEAEQAQLRERMEHFLAQFPPARQRAILRGALVSVYLREEPGSDAAVWLPGAKPAEGREPGIAQQTIAALREIGLLDELDTVQTDDLSGVIRYPNAEVPEPSYRTVGIHGVWHNWLTAEAAATGKAPPGDTLSQRDRQRAHAQVERIAETIAERPEGYALEVREEDGRLVVYTERGNRFGTIRQGEAAGLRAGETIAVRGALASDGNLRVAIEGSK